MLLNTILALVPLVHTLPAPAPHDPTPSLAWAIPVDALAAARLSDVEGLMANNQKNAWIAFFQDPRWLEIEGLDDVLSQEETEVVAVFKSLWGVLAGSEEVVFWLEESDYINPNIFLVFQSTDEAIAAAVAQPSAVLETKVQMIDGHAVASDELFALAWKDGLGVLLIGDDAGKSTAEVLATLQRVKNTNKPGGLFESTPLGADRHSEDLELLLNINAFLDMFPEGDRDIASIPPSILAEIRGMGWMYMSITLGAGQTSDMNLVLPYAEDGYIAKFLSFASDANIEAFKRVPADAHGASVGNFDIASATYWILEELMEAEILSEEEFEQSMAMAEETIGFHPLEDLLNYFNGELLQVLFPMQETDAPMQGVVGGSYGLMLAGVDSVDEVNSALAGLSALVSTMFEVIETEEVWGTIWAMDAMGQLQVEFGNAYSDFFLNFAPGALAKMEAHRAAGPEATNLLSDPAAKAVLSEIQGLTATIFRTAGMAQQISMTVRMQLGMAPELDEELAAIRSIVDTFDVIVADHLTGWYGNGVTANGRLRIHSVTR